MKEKRKQEKGITLIALVITIIVLLILAGVTLSIVMNTGIVDNSKKAVNTYNAQQAKDKLAMAIYNYRIAKYMNSEKGLEDLIAEVGGDAVLNEDTGEYEVYVDGYDFTVSENLEITSEDTTGESPKTQYTVTIQTGDGILSTTQTRKVTQGKSMTLKAVVADDYVFQEWQIKDENGTTIKDKTNGNTIIKPAGNVTVTAIAKKGQTENTGSTNTNDYTFTNGTKAYNNPVIPVGFKAKQTEDAKWKSTDGKTVDDWNNGLVIEDSQGNEFVWVPVDGENVKYEKWYGEKNREEITNAVTEAKDLQDDLPNGITDETNKIEQYQGFYIARYEAGIPATQGELISSSNNRNTSGTGGIAPVSQKNQIPWNWINYTNSKANAEAMYKTENVKSGLLTGAMWDTTMLWLQNSGINVSSDSKSWGNYRAATVTGITAYTRKTGWNDKTESWQTATGAGITKPGSTTESSDYMWLLKTGNTDYTKRKNIYDLAGNVWDWTNEIYSSYRVNRGGWFVNDGSDCPACYRSYTSITGTASSLGFRVGLYLT